MGPREISDAVDRLKGTFLEMPGTKLTVQQASRLCGLDTSACGIVLEVLRDAGFLTTRPDGTFMLRLPLLLINIALVVLLIRQLAGAGVSPWWAFVATLPIAA